MARPTSYKPEYAEQAQKLTELGATDVELADFFHVSINTIGNWKTSQAEFLGALKLGKEAADERVEKSLYHRAIGYTFDAVKIFPPGRPVKRGDRWTKPAPVLVPYREHAAPDTTACIFWLKNRRPDLWRDVSRHEVDPIRLLVEGLTDDELARVAAGGSPGASAAPKGSKESG